MRRLTSFLLALALLAPCAARGDEGDDELARGVALRRERRDADALLAFEHAYALRRSPRALAQIALAEAALGKWSAAEADLGRALAEKEDPWIARQRTVFEMSLGEFASHLSTVDLRSAEGAEIWLDGELAGHAPASGLRVAEGRHGVVVRAVGMTPQELELDLRGGENARLDLPLLPEPRDVPPVREPERAPAPGFAAPPPLTWASSGRSQRLVGWSLMGGAALLGAGGALATAWTTSNAGRYNDSAVCDRPGAPRSVQCAGSASAVRTGETLEAIAYGAAGAAAIVAAILLLTAPHAEPARGGLSCAPALGGAACRYIF